MHNFTFKLIKRLDYWIWICKMDGRLIAHAFTLPGVRAKVLQLLRHNNWS